MSPKRMGRTVYDISDYILALIWFTGTISGDAILIRNTDPYVAKTIARRIGVSGWIQQNTRERARWVCKINRVDMIATMRGIGFTGAQDENRLPPPVDALTLAKAFAETHTTLGWQLRYDRRHYMDKDFAYYIPRLQYCARPKIMQVYVDALANLGCAQPRLLCPAANGASATVIYTSHTQMVAMHRMLSPPIDGETHEEFWECFHEHINSKPIPYHKYKAKGEETDR